MDVRTFRKRFKFSLLAATAIALSGCASTPEPVIGPAVTQPRADLGQEIYSNARSPIYLLRPSDRISVNVFREPDFSIPDVRIGVEGNVSLPMLGSIPAAGMTAAQFEKDVEGRLLAMGLKSPMVNVNIGEYASHQVTVDGAVNDPGVYNFQPGARLSAAIALADGPARTAKGDEIAVFRESPEGTMVAKFDYGQISQGTMLDPVLQPGDRVFVGTDGLAVFWQDFLQTVPVLGVFALNAARIDE
ncbi:MAG: polysaccharide biosynthesis/export family protein [Erythrobacter sp.]|uniref:polysaccharide biosynthesis/export family protein n=1 Tax=Erythrobacter sp. TaxID=1042 RepID=UPI002614801B|nr:polysaccharide biosynthesis/export family protein [Erythrobacter sp.]MDJ0979367.1 polysaccharide biosynthesis/export family protein [Erythrobacter sp.]